MINNVILVGRLADDPKLYSLDGDLKVCDITLAVQRPFKDIETGSYSADFIKVSVWNAYAKSTADFAVKGDTIGVKGRLAQKVKEVDGVKQYHMEVIGERVVFINLKGKPNISQDDSMDELDTV